MEVVVARYNESIDWTRNLPYKVHVYNKGDALEGTIPLENIGREAHTYLHFIVENYNSLPEFVLFLQGNPFDHGDVPFQEWYLNMIKKGYTPNMTSVIEPGDFHETRPGVTMCPLTLGEWAKEHIGPGPEFPNLLMYIGACFGVRRDFILSRPKEYYENLLKQHTTTNPEEAYFMERMWIYVFKIHTKFRKVITG
jgi:hypothetical protein